jgi:hypothetical protein
VSGDKDFYQLIGPRIALSTGRGGPAGVDETWVDETNANCAPRRSTGAGHRFSGVGRRQLRQRARR